MGFGALMLLIASLFLLFVLSPAWKTLNTDFPSYYTAAVELRRGCSLTDLYDWTWFQRQMNYAGCGLQRGAYQPNTPLAMVPFLPLTWVSPFTAKRIWIVLNCGLLAGALWLLSSVTRFSVVQLSLLAACGWNAWRMNFVYGQYYVFLLFLLTLLFVCLYRLKEKSAGVLAGIIFALKLYSGPFFLFFVARKKWKAAATMAVTILVSLLAAIALFGWHGTAYYLTQVAWRSLEGGSIDLYNPGNPTLATLLQRSFVREPELNPAPIHESPWLFFFLRSLISLAILGFAMAGVEGESPGDLKRAFAWFTLAIMLLSTSISPYTYVLLFLPTVLLLDEATPLEAGLLVLSFVALTGPNLAKSAHLFPKVWILLFLFAYFAIPCLRTIKQRRLLALGAAILLIAMVDARWHLYRFKRRADQQFEAVKIEPGALFSSAPAVSRLGIFYQGMGRDRYVLRWLRSGRIETLTLDGHAFLPKARTADGPIDFELVANGKSTAMQLDVIAGRAQIRESGQSVEMRRREPVPSPDGRWVAWTQGVSGPRQIWVQRSDGTGGHALTEGACNSWDPAWELDSQSIVFASDCGRAVGLPTLRRAWIR